ncbi:MAG: PDZ domain-containing protein [Pirellulales bacterium]
MPLRSVFSAALVYRFGLSCSLALACWLGSAVATLAQDSSPAESALPAFLPEGRSKAFLGVVSRAVDDGAVIQRVVERSAAWDLGLEAGDVVQAIDGFQVGVINGATYSLPSEIRRSGDKVELQIRDRRTGDVIQRTAEIGGRATNKGSLDSTPRLGVNSEVSTSGESVVRIAPDSPAKRAGVRVGDVIKSVDGYRVGVIDGNIYSLASEIRHSAEQCVLTVQRGGQSLRLPVQFKAGPIDSATRVHLLLIGLTDDDKIGPGIEGNLMMLEAMLEPVSSQQRASFQKINGADCNARNILQQIRALNVQPGEAVFCYYAGHGAYDPQRTDRNDRSGGHFLQIPGGDLLRKTIMDELRTKNAKLTVLVTDTCNVPSVPELFGSEPGEPMFDEPPIVTLLLRYRGVVDVSGSSRGQYGWFTRGFGIFTLGFVRAVGKGGGTWSGVLDSADEATRKEFHNIKEAVLADPSGMDPNTLAQIRNQRTQAPQAFQLDVTRD